MTVSGSVPSSKNAARSTRRSSIPSRRLAQNVRTRNLRKLLRNQIIKEVIRNNPHIVGSNQRREPFHRLLNHRAFAIQRQHLLRPASSGFEARTVFRCHLQESPERTSAPPYCLQWAYASV